MAGMALLEYVCSFEIFLDQRKKRSVKKAKSTQIDNSLKIAAKWGMVTWILYNASDLKRIYVTISKTSVLFHNKPQEETLAVCHIAVADLDTDCACASVGDFLKLLSERERGLDVD